MLGRPPVSPVDPTTILTASSALDNILRRIGDGSLWEKTLPFPTSAPYYTRWGVPDPVSDPGSVASDEGKYVVDPSGAYWRWETSKYSLLNPQPKPDPSPATVIPDATRMNPYLMYEADLYGMVSPIPASPSDPYYELLGTPVVTTDDPSALDPGPDYYIVDGAVWAVVPGPYYYKAEPGTSGMDIVSGPWIEFGDADWHRIRVRTSVRQEDENRVSFLGAYWIDVRIEVQNVAEMRVSSVMLDPHEDPYAQYFDGSMVEDSAADDFLWSEKDKTTGEPLANRCISYYYYDRAVRVKWLYENLRYLVPVSLPYQIFFGGYELPYIPPGGGHAISTAYDVAL
jgi:hypothetical protein